MLYGGDLRFGKNDDAHIHQGPPQKVEPSLLTWRPIAIPHSHSIVSGRHNHLISLWKIFFEVKNTVAESGKKLRF